MFVLFGTLSCRVGASQFFLNSIIIVLLLFSAACAQSNGFNVHRNGTTTNGVTNGISRRPVFPPASSMTSASTSDVTVASDEASGISTQPRERKKYVNMFMWMWVAEGEVLGLGGLCARRREGLFELGMGVKFWIQWI